MRSYILSILISCKTSRCHLDRLCCLLCSLHRASCPSKVWLPLLSCRVMQNFCSKKLYKKLSHAPLHCVRIVLHMRLPACSPASRNQAYAGIPQPMVLKISTKTGVRAPRPTPPRPKGVLTGNTMNIWTKDGTHPVQHSCLHIPAMQPTSSGWNSYILYLEPCA